MASVATIDNALRRGLGQGVKGGLATYFNVYRLKGLSGTPNAATSIVDPLNKVLTNFPIRMVKNAMQQLVEQEPIYKLVYQGMCDTRQLKIGDVFIEVGPIMTDVPDGRMFYLADVQPILPAMFVRAEISGSASRPHDASQTDEPLLGRGRAAQAVSKGQEWLYILDNSLYDVQAVGTPATIPMGIQPYNRVGPAQEMKFPTGTRRGVHYLYLPLLPGLQIEPGDYVLDDNRNHYRIQTVQAFTTGLQGYQLIAETTFI